MKHEPSGALDACWHCGILLEPEPPEHCEHCPPFDGCDVEGCLADGCNGVPPATTAAQLEQADVLLQRTLAECSVPLRLVAAIKLHLDRWKPPGPGAALS